ncbi:MAG: hypothetical protein B7Z55_06375 [Planctomycetales bacterium 12-60-4]|nr:MAG: hypothetical protein B7Z55_06375 [Planctomycetales bacterium 12-60-4]
MAAGTGGRPGRYEERPTELALYDLETDDAESINVAAAHSDVVARLQQLAEQARKELGDALTGAKGTEVRPAGRLER